MRCVRLTSPKTYRAYAVALHILDTTVLSNFARIGRVDLLRLSLGDQGAMTGIVYDELHAGEATGRVPQRDWTWLPIIDLSTSETTQYKQLAQLLGGGEASCLAVAIQRRATIVTDDQAARRYGLKVGVAVTGTLGLLRVLVRKGHLTLSEADEVLVAMVSQGYRSPVRRLSELPD